MFAFIIILDKKLSEIRVGYSGLISFATGIMMIFSGLVFTLILTRNLSPEQYGTWNLILGLIIYGLILVPTISYWATRETARNIQSQKTSVFFGGIFSLIGILGPLSLSKTEPSSSVIAIISISNFPTITPAIP